MINADFNTSLKMLSEEMPPGFTISIKVDAKVISISMPLPNGKTAACTNELLRPVDQINILLQIAKDYAAQT